MDFSRFEQHPDRDNLFALVLLGSYPWWEEWEAHETAKLDALKHVLRTTDIPIIGFCGGHQLVAKAFAGTGAEPVGHMFESDRKRERLDPPYYGEDKGFRPEDHDGETYLPREPGYDEEYGKVCAVQLTPAGRSDSIYASLGLTGRDPEFMFWHRDEIKILHRNFVLLGSTKLSRNQSVKHNERLIYTTQFHPEDAGSPDGPGYVRAFFELARNHHAARVNP